MKVGILILVDLILDRESVVVTPLGLRRLEVFMSITNVTCGY